MERYVVEIEDLPARITAMTRNVIHPQDLGATIGQESDRLEASLSELGVEPSGPPYARYHRFTDQEVDLEVGYPVEESVQGEGLEPGSLPGGKAAVTIHWGDYQGLPHAFDVLADWVSEHAARRAAPWEVYWTDPGEVPVERWRTELIWPID